MLFRRKMTPQCAACERAIPMEGEDMLCRRYGIVSRGYHCRKFIYDPLKRHPSRTPPLSGGGKTYSLDYNNISKDPV